MTQLKKIKDLNSFENLGDVHISNLLLNGVDGTGNKLAPGLKIPM
jgi:hypothetical protein